MATAGRVARQLGAGFAKMATAGRIANFTFANKLQPSSVSR
jgi:hypothetical protein